MDLVSVQHEFGIFGGQAGSHLLLLLRELRMPVVTTLHTILSEPSVSTGADGDTLFMYYGAADTSIGVARGSLREILGWLDRNADGDSHHLSDHVAVPADIQAV